MCNVFGTAADERSSVATECELARKLDLSASLCATTSFVQLQRCLLSRTMESRGDLLKLEVLDIDVD